MIGIAWLRRRGLSAALFVICIDFAAMPVHAQLAPSQPIKIVVGVPAGGLGDLAARILAQRLSENGHPAIVENRLGVHPDHGQSFDACNPAAYHQDRLRSRERLGADCADVGGT